MPLSLAYWILMLFWLVAGCWVGYATPAGERRPWIGWSTLLFLMFLVIGLKLFGTPIRG